MVLSLHPLVSYTSCSLQNRRNLWEDQSKCGPWSGRPVIPLTALPPLRAPFQERGCPTTVGHRLQVHAVPREPTDREVGDGAAGSQRPATKWHTAPQRATSRLPLWKEPDTKIMEGVDHRSKLPDQGRRGLKPELSSRGRGRSLLDEGTRAQRLLSEPSGPVGQPQFSLGNQPLEHHAW